MKADLMTFIRTFKLEDFNVLSLTAAVTIIGKLCTGIIPIVAMVVAVYQIKLVKVRVRTEELKLKEAECIDREIEKEAIK